MKKNLERHLNSLDEKSAKEFEERVMEELEKVKDDIDFLFSLIQPEPPDLVKIDNHDYGVTIQITEEIYNELLKYSENKTHLFMGIS